MVNLFVIGAAKSATTSLYHLLDYSDSVRMCSVKEPNYFCDDYNSSKMTKYKWKMYDNITKKLISGNKSNILHEALIRDIDLYHKLFEFDKGTNLKYFGDASTNYFISKNAAQNIYNYNPSAKIIVILRNPFDRIVSHFNMKKQIGETTDHSLEQVLNRELDSFGQNNFNQYDSLLSHSLYHTNIKKFLDYFPKKQILVLFQLEKKQTEFYEYLKQNLVFFLDDKSFNCFEFEKINESKSYRFEFFKYLNANSRLKLVLKNLLGKNTKSIIKEKFLFSKKSTKSKTYIFPISVINILHSEIKQLETDFKVDLSEWYYL